jgi:hypothetical protein
LPMAKVARWVEGVRVVVIGGQGRESETSEGGHYPVVSQFEI